jgi:hypothetical protein
MKILRGKKEKKKGGRRRGMRVPLPLNSVFATDHIENQCWNEPINEALFAEDVLES